MKECMYKNYDELPLFLNAETVAKLLGISISSSYELMHEICSIQSCQSVRRCSGLLNNS